MLFSRLYLCLDVCMVWERGFNWEVVGLWMRGCPPSMLEALEPRYSHHCYVRADDRHASAIGPILRIDQLPAGSYEFTGCGYGLGAVSVCQLPLHLGM